MPTAADIVDLKFVNNDAKPKITEMSISLGGVADVMVWYGAYYAGDRYSVFINGAKVQKDHNGELVGAIS